MKTRMAFPRLEFSPCNPFLRPDRRWRRCVDLAEHSKRARSRFDDAEIRTGLRFLKALRRCRSEEDRACLARQTPNLYGAYELHAEHGMRQWVLEAHLLTTQSLEIGRRSASPRDSCPVRGLSSAFAIG